MALLLGTLYKYTQNFIVYMGMFLAYLYFQPNIVHIMYWFLLSFWLIQPIFHLFSSVQCSRSVVSDSLRPHESQHTRPPPPLPAPGVHPNPCPLSQWCHSTISSSVHLLLLLPSIFPRIRVFSNESALCISWPKYWGFSFNISPSNENPGLISFRMDWLDLLAVQGTLKSLLQHHSSKALILCPQLSWHSNSPIHIWPLENIALTRWTFAGKVMPLFLNMLSTLVITFLPRSKCLLISWLICSDFGAQKNQVSHCFHCFHIC